METRYLKADIDTRKKMLGLSAHGDDAWKRIVRSYKRGNHHERGELYDLALNLAMERGALRKARKTLRLLANPSVKRETRRLMNVARRGKRYKHDPKEERRRQRAIQEDRTPRKYRGRHG